MLRHLSLCCLLTGALLAGFAPARAQNQTRFQTGVEVTSIDVTAVDRSNKPVTDLKASELIVRIDDVARRVVTAEWVPTQAGTAEGRASAALTQSNRDGTSGRERFILIVVDQPNIRFGGAIGHRAAINSFVDRLEASDRVGIINLGVGGSSVSFTTDRDQVKQAVSTAVGGVPHPFSSKTPGEQTLIALRALMNDMRALNTPKTMILISQGLVFDREARPRFDELEQLAAAARTTIYALRLDERIVNISREPTARSVPAAEGQPESTSAGTGSSRELPDTPFPAGPAGDRGPQGMEAAGELSDIAAATGGAMFNVTTNATSALSRVESALAGYYLVGVEFAATEDNSRPHRLRVETSRKNVIVRTRRYLPNLKEAPVPTPPSQP